MIGRKDLSHPPTYTWIAVIDRGTALHEALQALLTTRSLVLEFQLSLVGCMHHFPLFLEIGTHRFTYKIQETHALHQASKGDIVCQPKQR